MKRFLLVSLSIFTGLSAFATIKDSAKELNNALELVIKKLPLQLDDPIKEMADTEEEEAFELLIKSKLNLKIFFRNFILPDYQYRWMKFLYEVCHF
jgi:hypothetical protein